MNRDGILRLIEAIIAIVIIFGVIFIFFAQSRVGSGVDLSGRAGNILEEISKDVTLREAVLNNDTDVIGAFVADRILEAHLDFEVKLCEVGSVCGKSVYTEGNVYSAERIISSTLNDFDPKKIRLFIWER